MCADDQEDDDQEADEVRQPLPDAQAKMVVALRANFKVALEPFVVDEGAILGTLDPALLLGNRRRRGRGQGLNWGTRLCDGHHKLLSSV